MEALEISGFAVEEGRAGMWEVEGTFHWSPVSSSPPLLTPVCVSAH